MIQVIDAYNESNGYVQVASVAAATGVGAIPAHTKAVYIQPEGGDVRWRDDGADPTAAAGMILSDGQILKYIGKIADIKFIDIAGPAKLNVTFYK